ncbi:unnamed protein product [Heterobilharzia americana]|nr:unnamed protein product [Heterobilharzia americana]
MFLLLIYRQGQLSLSENKFDFLKSRSRLNVLRNITAKCASKSPVVVDVSSLQVEDEGFAEELVECTNPISVYHSLPTNKSGVVVSHFGHPPLQAKSSHESQIATSSCLSQCANDEVSTLSVNHSASNSMKPHTKYPVKGRTLTNIRPHISEQHARSTSPSHLFDTYSPSKSTNDFIDEMIWKAQIYFT